MRLVASFVCTTVRVIRHGVCHLHLNSPSLLYHVAAKFDSVFQYSRVVAQAKACKLTSSRLRRKNSKLSQVPVSCATYAWATAEVELGNGRSSAHLSKIAWSPTMARAHRVICHTCRNARRILVRGVNAPLPPETKILKI